MTTIEKAVSKEIEKWSKFRCNLIVIKDLISISYCDISLEDNDTKKNYFINLHYLKMKKDYIYLKIYHYNIKKLSSNEKLLCYFESILVANGFDLEKW